MARPVNANAAETRRKILAAATERFAARGEAGASVRSVARTAGVSLATVHHYFGNKESLYRACVEAMEEEFSELRRQLLALAVERSGGPLEELLDAGVRQAFRFARQHVVAVRLTTRDAVERGEMSSSRQLGMLIPGLAEGVEFLGQLTGAAPETLRLTLRSLTFLIVRYAVSSPRELTLVLGWDPEQANEAACLQAVEEHLVRSARALMSALTPGDA